MAIINYTADYNLAAGAVKVEWSGLSSGDQGQPFDSTGLKLASIQYWGMSGNIAVQASNEATPSNFSPIHDSSSATMQLVLGSNVVKASMGAVRPVASGGDGSVAILFVKE